MSKRRHFSPRRSARFSLITGNFLSPSRCVQLPADAADAADGDVARRRGGPGEQPRRGELPAVLLELQEPAGEHQGAPQKRESDVDFIIIIIIIHRLSLLFYFIFNLFFFHPGVVFKLLCRGRTSCVSASRPAEWW